MENPGDPLDLAGAVRAWALALAAGLLVFLAWRWVAGPDFHWLEVAFGCFLFAAVAMAVRRAVASRAGS